MAAPERTCLFVALVVLAGTLGAQAATPADVDPSLTATYFHGITEEIAREQVGAERLPEILALLEDPDFPRRDNLVAFLAFLGGTESTPALVRLIEAPVEGLLRPEDDRARLLAPQVLGKIAGRGDDAALEYLLRMTAADAPAGRWEPDLVDSALLGLGWADRPLAKDRLADVARGRIVPGSGDDGDAHVALIARERLTSEVEPSTDGGPTGSDSITADFDTQSREHDNDLTYANHPDVPNPMTNARLDSILHEASLRAGRGDYDGDVACCIRVTRLGDAKSFGSPGDGLDRIDNNSELSAVLNNSVSRVKVVRAINYCGGPGFNIIGCAQTPGTGMAVVRRSGFGSEAVLWIHEYGHNTGLGHVGDSRRIMYSFDTGNNRGLSQGECNFYHSPFFLAQPIVTDIGACTDLDGDEVQDGIDNCPDVANTDQADADGDGIGDACEVANDADGDGVPDVDDNCPDDWNEGQEDFDADGSGDVCDPDDDDDGVADGADCAPFDASVTALAGPASSVAWTAGSTTEIGWSPGTQASASNLYRGDFAASFDPSWDCYAADLPGSSFDETATPDAGTGFHYLVTGENVCGESGAGEDSEGAPRSVTACP